MSGATGGSKSQVKKNERKAFKAMTGTEKGVFLVKAVVCLCTLCFVFPSVFAMADAGIPKK